MRLLTDMLPRVDEAEEELAKLIAALQSTRGRASNQFCNFSRICGQLERQGIAKAPESTHNKDNRDKKNNIAKVKLLTKIPSALKPCFPSPGRPERTKNRGQQLRDSGLTSVGLGRSPRYTLQPWRGYPDPPCKARGV